MEEVPSGLRVSPTHELLHISGEVLTLLIFEDARLCCGPGFPVFNCEELFAFRRSKFARVSLAYLGDYALESREFGFGYGFGVAESGEGWSGIVANIHAPFFLENAAALAAALVADGLLVASGFVHEQVDEIARALGAAGLREVERRSSGPWVLWVGRRRDDAGGA